MRILFFTYWMPCPIWGGIVQRAASVTRRLARRHEIHLVALTNPFGSDGGDLRGLCASVQDLGHSTRQSVGKFLKSLALGTPYQVVRAESGSARRRLRGLLRGLDVDITFIDHTFLSAYLPELTHPRVVFYHNLEYRLLQSYGQRAPLPRRLYARLQTRSMRAFELTLPRRVEGVLFASPVEERLVREMYPDLRSQSSPCGVDVEAFSPSGTPVSPHHLVFVGNFTYRPNVEAVHFLVNHVLPRIAQRFTDVTLDIIGYAPPLAVRRYASEGIRVTGRVPDLSPWIAPAAVCVVPLLTGAGTKFKLVEALAMGKAVVSTSVGAEGLALQSEREVLIADDPESFGEAVCRVLASPELRTRLESAARVFAVRRHDWDVLVPELEDFLAATVEECRGGSSSR